MTDPLPRPLPAPAVATPVAAAPTPDAPCLYTAALDAGDRLAAALGTGDLGGAARLLGERGRLIAQIQSAGLDAPSPELVERFKSQDSRLTRVLQGRMTSLSDAIATTGRAAIAHDRYVSSTGAAAAVLDTAPR